jgi:ketosteroid isomerase-like protein
MVVSSHGGSPSKVWLPDSIQNQGEPPPQLPTTGETSSEDLFAQFPGPVEADLSELKVVADGTFGYAHLIDHSALTDKDGKKVESTVRTTDVFRKMGGKWLIVHEHNSVPVDLATGKADMTAKP